MSKTLLSFSVAVFLITLSNGLCQSIVLSGNSSNNAIQRAIHTTVNMNGQLYEPFGGSIVPGTVCNASEYFDIHQTFLLKRVSVAVQSDGKIVVAGVCSDDQGTHFAVSRFTKDGQPDSSFGKTTATTICPSPGFVYIQKSIVGTTYVPDIFDAVGAVAIDSKGSIVLAGYSWYNNDAENALYAAFARFTQEGILDESFGQNETYTTSYIPGTVFVSTSITGSPLVWQEALDIVNAIAIHPNGTITGVGFSNYYDQATGYTFTYASLFQLTEDGALDQAFGVNNDIIKSNVPGTEYINHSIILSPSVSTAQDQLTSIAIATDDTFFAGGLSRYFSGGMDDFTSGILLKFLPDGSLDELFGRNGNGTQRGVPGSVYLVRQPSNQFGTCITGLALSGKGTILASGLAGNIYGYSSDAFSFFSIFSFTAEGALTPFFGKNTLSTRCPVSGYVYIDQSISGVTNQPTIRDYAQAICLQEDGKSILVGYTGISSFAPESFYKIALARFTESGLLDETFGADQGATDSLIPGTVFIKKSVSGNSAGTFDQCYDGAILSTGFIALGCITQPTSAHYSPNNKHFATALFFNPQLPATFKRVYSKIGSGLNC